MAKTAGGRGHCRPGWIAQNAIAPGVLTLRAAVLQERHHFRYPLPDLVTPKVARYRPMTSRRSISTRPGQSLRDDADAAGEARLDRACNSTSSLAGFHLAIAEFSVSFLENKLHSPQTPLRRSCRT